MMKNKQKVHEMHPHFKGKPLKYWQQLQSLMDAHHTRAHNLEYRKRFLDKQSKMNYQHEYDRLRNAMEQTVMRRHPLAGHRVRGPMLGDEARAVVGQRLEDLRQKGAK